MKNYVFFVKYKINKDGFNYSCNFGEKIDNHVHMLTCLLFAAGEKVIKGNKFSMPPNLQNSDELTVKFNFNNQEIELSPDFFELSEQKQVNLCALIDDTVTKVRNGTIS